MSYDPNDAKSIFLQAAELPSATERAEFLDRVCAGKPELKARVECLLKTALDPDSLLDGPVADFGATQMVPQDASPVTLDFLEPCDVPGRLGRLGGHEVLEIIGRGGMGIVLRAMDAKLNRVVAIKSLAPELASNPQARKRFLREAQAAAAVSHDHVVTIHAVDDGASANNKVPFLVMECIVGQSLQQKIDCVGALSLKEILRIGMQIAAGLAAAHKQGLVHRDIKPANILLENGVERVKITDFGLARATDDVGITQSGQIAGTPQYMSPEQAQGLPVDHRSDLFSLGSVLYTMCTGRPAFRADSAVAVLRRVCDDTPRPIGEVNPEIPDWLIAIVNRLMAKRPEDRFSTAQEVAALLEQWLAHCQQPEAVAKPTTIAASVSRTAAPQRQAANDSSRGILGQVWHDWWSERDRWVAISVQTVLVLVYVVCMICFVSMGGSGGHDAEGRPKFSYRLGVPTPWFRFEVNQEPNVLFSSGFNLWTSSVLIGLMGCAAYYVYWRIEKVRNPEMSKWDRPAFMLGAWGIGALFAVGLGHWQGYATLAEPRGPVSKPVSRPTPQDAPAASSANHASSPAAGNDGIAWGPSSPKGMQLGVVLEPQKADYTFNEVVTAKLVLRNAGSEAISFTMPRLEVLEKFDFDLSAADDADHKLNWNWSNAHKSRGELTVSGGTAAQLRPGRTQELPTAKIAIGCAEAPSDVIACIDVKPGQVCRLRFKLGTYGYARGEGEPLESGLIEFRIAERGPPSAAVVPFETQQAQAHQVAWAKHLGVEVELKNSIGMKLRLIPPGEFTMGSSAEEVGKLLADFPEVNGDQWSAELVRDEAPARRVAVRLPFYLGAHEVTVGQFREFVTAAQYRTVAEQSGGGLTWNLKENKWDQRPENIWNNAQHAMSDAHPVGFLTLTDALAFCEWLSAKENRRYVVPTDEQWEFACRAGTESRWYFGDDPAVMKQHGWTLPHSLGTYHAVGRLAANPFGLFDVYGNASELTVDALDRAVERGGTPSLSAARCRSANRWVIDKPHETVNGRSFRVALVVASPSSKPPSIAAIDLNGDWDSRWRTVTFIHEPPQPGETTIPMRATYYNGASKIDGALNLTTRTFEGRFSESNGMNGPIRLVVSSDGRTITGRYAYRQQGMNADPTELMYEWDMTRH